MSLSENPIFYFDRDIGKRVCEYLEYLWKCAVAARNALRRSSTVASYGCQPLAGVGFAHVGCHPDRVNPVKPPWNLNNGAGFEVFRSFGSSA